MSDIELLRDYLATRSERAFAELVDRYIDLVYSAARRQVRDTHLAEDITQAVFIVLARKAGAIRNPGILGAWLIKTTRQTSYNAIRFERCRRRHEQEAATMNTALEQTGAEPVGANVEGVLDEFLARLGERDRGAIVLRYMQQKSVEEVAVALRISPPAAQKRITRALSRLKNLLTRRGIVTAGAALEQGLCLQVLHTAPPGLARLASSSAVAKSSGGGAALLARSTVRTLFWAKVQALALGLVASGAVVAMVAAVAVNSLPDTRASAENNPPAPATPPTTPPAVAQTHIVHLANDAFWAQGPADEYINEIDPNTKRTPDSGPAGHIKSLIPNIPRNGIYTDLTTIVARRLFVGPLDKYRGKRIRFSGWIKTKDVRECAGLEMFAYSADGALLINNPMVTIRLIHGTTDWREYEIVQDIPEDATRIILSAALSCSGEMWTDGFQTGIVGSDVPVTDNESWHIFSPTAQRYSVTVDPAVQHDGHATTCFRSSTASHAQWATYEYSDLRPDPKFLGHRIRMTAWIKSAGVTGKCGLQIHTFGAWDKQLTDEGQQGHRPIMGTRDWQQYSAVVDVPAETKTIYWSLTLNGRGKLWMDMDSVQVDLADDAANPGDTTGL
jgi:RNA polymerase sigma factor (sigma-70 family)